MKSSIALIATLLLTSTGCAYMFNGGHQEVTIETNPSDADIRNNGKFLGTGGATTSLDRSGTNNLVVSAAGYDDGYVYLQKKMNAAWMFWDIGTCIIPITLCIPVLVDAISGAWNGYEDHSAVKLKPSVAAPIPAPQPANPSPPPGQQIIIVK